ncbi:F-box and WD domain-containing protein [Pyrenophora tritici-repentis]|uniref:F-box and WD domain-containing protein n=2 Tax=Pyrenophora tritici-repentis TaxID=45151 RepID=A0A2W1DJP5_9PLEO|nr:F-box and WD domain-containing protein [Pyrenophora tritici-repentis]KAF7442361.1 F-box and WD domain-containing protein [Pyrenophora tritici-repentis]KAF7579268.1 F-box and WD domain-containing protein [Pyrenophora tritici-repentis]KAI1513136.1 F-box domain containing protein [Pyrenophora tritici-repentis]KAI1547927.1 F-box and WD domain-containing protein [Pyrenophora tritici-repentis]
METPGALTNATSFLPSPVDLLMALPRLFAKATSLGDMMRSGGSIIAEPTANLTNTTVTITASFVQESVVAVASAASVAEADMTAWQALRNVATWFSYITSKWAIATFALMIVLNRTHFYGSSRVPLSFDRLYLRFALYILPLAMFLFQIQSVLRAIRCQTCPGWSEMQYGAPDRQLDTDFAGEGGFLWRVASTVLFWETTEESCRAANMFPLDPSLPRVAGSMALLWPLFLTLGFGQFIDTLACALQGRRPIQEVGMTIFEHSLAFAEAEALTHFLKQKSIFTPDGTLLMMPKSKLSRMANVPPEVLLISLISSLSYFTSNLLAIFGVRSRYRLVTTTIWGLAYMSAFAWSFNRLTLMVADPDHHVGILRFPTVCIIGFIPHLLILVGITVCGFIYALALLITVLSPPAGQTGTLRERFAAAYGNLHANIHLSSITPLTINWHEDFYTTILKVGYVILTAASEAVFLNEGTKVNVHPTTWLDKKRLHEFLARRRKTREALCSIPSELKNETFAPGVEAVNFTDINTGTSTSGYAKERKTRGVKPPTDPSSSMGQHDPALQQRSRYFQAYQFFLRIAKLIILSAARITDWTLTKIAISYRPRWLERAADRYAEKLYTPTSGPGRSHYQTISADPWLTMDDRSRVRQDQAFDVESFAKERLRQSGFYAEPDTEVSEERLNDYLYSWWRNGGIWNDVDNSKDYVVPEDDDTTSVVSFATTTDNDEWSDIDDGQRTPTRDSYQRSREETPLADDAMDFSRLSQLLDPRTREDREEAKLLSRHLQSSKIMTRSQYREALEREEAKILTTSRYKVGGSDDMSPEEEEQLLEDIILNRRSATAPQGANTAGSWDTGAEGMGSDGPQCVHGQRRSDDLQHSLQPHKSELWREPPTGGPAVYATRPDDISNENHTGEPDGLKAVASSSPPPKDRITEYENALANSPRKHADGPLFEVIKANTKPGDKSSPIAKLPNEVLIHAIAHLSPNDLAAVSLVSRRFHDVVTTPHAWQVAFGRYFPGSHSLEDAAFRSAQEDNGTVVRSEKRRFARLTALASWRSEYILRTRLLRSLVRGKPVQVPTTPSRAAQMQTVTPMITYDAKTYTIINHLQATFGSGLNKKMPRFIHGADDIGMVTSSDPVIGKVDPWGQSDPHFYGQFAERFPGVAEWGLGSGEVVGCPNVMDVSQPYGMIYGQGCPEGSCYYRSLEEMRGRFIAEPSDFTLPEAGIPKLGIDGGAICSVWIAKSSTIPTLSEGLIGMMVGSAAGVVTACSIGTDGLRSSRVQRGELTARWVLSPGVPIIAIAVDEQYSSKRYAQNRIWAVALNALGEVFYLTKFPTRSQVPKGDMEQHTEYLGWLTGRSVYWNLVEPSRRTARPDPYSDADVDGSYSPRTSWDGMCLSKEQITAETKEIQQFLRQPPKHFRKVCLGWDMRRRLEIDFAGDDGHYAGEAMIVFECGLEEGDIANVKRFTRCKTDGKDKTTNTSTPTSVPQSAQLSSLFGGPGTGTPDPTKVPPRVRSSSYISTSSSPERANLVEEWRCSKLTFGGFKSTQVTATTLDISTFATLTLSEDPALGFSTASTASSPYASPMSVASQPASPSDIPGQRARFVAAGTKSGVVLLWDIRAPVSRSSEYTNDIAPVRIIYTDSPEISCLAVTSLYLVVGGNDGLVQAWDPLASSMSPITTLHSRHASRARRQLVQAQASVQGVGINMFAAGAVCLDPDPTVLRGAVSLGNQLRFWSYSSSAADQYRSSKRRLRRAERGSNNAGERFPGTGRGNLKHYIANEQFELERDEKERHKQAERLAGRFGTELLSEEEALAYAAMLSQETLEAEELRRIERESAALSAETMIPEPSVQASSSSPAIKDDEELDADIAEAIRLSLNDNSGPSIYESALTPPSAFEIPIKYAKDKKASPSRSQRNGAGKGKAVAGSSNESEMSDLEFAMQLSLAEEQSRKDAEDAFPPLSPAPGGKGKGRMW